MRYEERNMRKGNGNRKKNREKEPIREKRGWRIREKIWGKGKNSRGIYKEGKKRIWKKKHGK